MATSATWLDRFLGKGGVEVEAEVMADARQRRAADYRLRAFPNEDVHFFSKRIDNTRVIRQADPQTPKTCWKMIGGASASAVLLIGLLLPSGYRLMAGYQMEDLKNEQERLLLQKAELELAEARLLSPQRLAELARIQEFVDPDPSHVVHLGDNPAQLAMRRTAPVPVPHPARTVTAEPIGASEPTVEAAQ